MPARPRYRFGEFTLSPSRRVLLRGDREIQLIPRYFDLLLLLLERRNEAVHRRELLESVWTDVVVSDGALSQAVRSLRRVLTDDPREPIYIRTVSRHGYRFVFEAVQEEPDDAALPRTASPALLAPAEAGEEAGPIEGALVRLAARRWGQATSGGAAAGILAGAAGAALLRFGPGSQATNAVLGALPIVGLTIGGLGAAGTGAGLAAAETFVRTRRGPALVAGGAAGGAAIGATTHLLAAWVFAGLFGRDLAPVAGWLEGVVLGGAVGLGYALATWGAAGLAAPRGAARVAVAACAGVVAAGAAATLAWHGSHLGATSLDFLAHAFPDSQVGLAPVARLFGEPQPGLVTRAVISAGEGFMFGFGTILGLTHRPRPAAAA